MDAQNVLLDSAINLSCTPPDIPSLLPPLPLPVTVNSETSSSLPSATTDVSSHNLLTTQAVYPVIIPSLLGDNTKEIISSPVPGATPSSVSSNYDSDLSTKSMSTVAKSKNKVQCIVNVSDTSSSVISISSDTVKSTYDNTLLQSMNTLPVVIPLLKAQDETVNISSENIDTQTSATQQASGVDTQTVTIEEVPYSISVASQPFTANTVSSNIPMMSTKFASMHSSPAIATLKAAQEGHGDTNGNNQVLYSNTSMNMQNTSLPSTTSSQSSKEIKGLQDVSTNSVKSGNVNTQMNNISMSSTDGGLLKDPSVCQPSLCYTRILLGEITPLLAAMRRATPRWSQHQSVSSY